VIELRAGDLEATFVPDAGMVGSSLRHRGEELLGQRGGLDAYRERGSSFGIPLLAPWANRLGGLRYGEVELDAERSPLKLDGNGLPIHGLLTASPRWEVTEANDDRLAATLAFDAPELLAAFPFPHELRLDVTLAADRLTVATAVRPTGVMPVPLAFGWHPYLRPAGAPRADWLVELPVVEHALLDGRGIPTGGTEPAGDLSGALGEREFDDLYPVIEERAVFAVEGGGRRLEVAFEEGYPVAQVYAPAGEDFICFEPMTAPTNALVSGDGLRRINPGAEFSARFSIGVTD
jgi:galactose mutarotase-like enzyme